MKNLEKLKQLTIGELLERGDYDTNLMCFIQIGAISKDGEYTLCETLSCDDCQFEECDTAGLCVEHMENWLLFDGDE